MLQTNYGNFRPAQKLPKMTISGNQKLPTLATFELLTIFEQQKLATSGNLLTAHNCYIWQFLNRPRIDKTGNCLQFPQLLLLFFALNTHNMVFKVTGNKCTPFIKDDELIDCGI